MQYHKGRKRGRTHSPALQGSEISLNFDLPTPTDPNALKPELKTDAKILESSVVVNHLKQLGKEANKSLPQNVYLKLEVGLPESKYLEFHHDDILSTLKDNFALTDLSISEIKPGTIERYITLNGDIQSVVKSSLYISYIIRVELNNTFYRDTYTLKSPNYRLYLIESDELTVERARQIEQKAKFSSLTYFDLCRPGFYSSKTAVVPALLKLEVIGSFKSVYDFLYYVIDTSNGKFTYLEDSKMYQIPIVHADDSNLYQTQEFNGSVLANNIKDSVNHIYNQDYIKENQLL